MAEPTIKNGEEHFFPIIYEGNGAGQRVGKFVPFTDNGTIANSVIFNDADNAYVSKTFGTPTNNKKWTLSAWVKLGVLGTNRALISSNINGAEYFDLFFTTGNVLKAQNRISSSNDLLSSTSRTFEDTSKFYHFLIVYDSDNSTSADRYIVYVDGDRLTVDDEAGSGVASAFNKSGVQHQVGISNTLGSSGVAGLGYQFDGYMAEVNFVDGSALTPDTFGLTDTSTGRWISKALTGITYGNNGFRLQFGSSSNFGEDTSGNNNDFSVINLVAGDQTTDSTTQNHATFDSGRNGGDWTLSEGNLKIVGTPSTGAGRMCLTGMNVPNSNKIYWEVEADAINDAPRYIGLFKDNVSLTAGASTEDMRWIAIRNGGSADGKLWDGKVVSSQLTTFSAGNIIQFARDGEKLWIGKNDTWLNSGNPSTGANPLLTNIDTNSNWKMGVWSLSTGLGGASHTFIMNAGQKTFSYTPPTGFSAWQQDNLPETAKGVSGMVWTKNRDRSKSPTLYDSSRGRHLALFTSGNDAQTTYTDGLQKFLAGGQQIEDNLHENQSGDSFVSWNWVANGGTTASNGDGSITSTVQANTLAGFSIVRWTGDGGQSTVGHGLSSTPKIVIQKDLDSTSDWWFYTTAIDGSYDYLKLNSSVAKSDFSATAPTSTVFTSHGWGTTSMIGYCFHEISGYSKFSSYTGNGSTDGPFIYTGFKPSFIMFKRTNSATDWQIQDNKRDTFNPSQKVMTPNQTYTEFTNSLYSVDFLSNGFKIRNSTSPWNISGSTYFYMAFAEHPFVGDGTNPVTAR